jgi:hypothetical protein
MRRTGGPAAPLSARHKRSARRFEANLRQHRVITSTPTASLLALLLLLLLLHCNVWQRRNARALRPRKPRATEAAPHDAHPIATASIRAGTR